MVPKKYGENLDIEEIIQIRRDIQERSAHIPREDRFQIGQLLEYVEGLSGWSCTSHQIRHLRRVYLLRPEVYEGDRNVNWYTRRDLQELILILTLQNQYGIPLTKVAGLLRLESQYQQVGQISRNRSAVVPFNQTKRAQYHLRGRLLEIILTWIFDNQVPFHSVALLRQKYSSRSSDKIAGKILANGVDWLTMIKRLVPPEPEDLAIMISDDGEVLHIPGEIDWVQWKAYQWLQVLLQGRIPPADYNIIIGVPPNSGLQFIPSITSSEAAELLTPILRLCFLKEWKETSSLANTPLQAIANMIPDISKYWQYCAILIPDQYSTSHSLRVLAHSDYFPRDLNTGKIILSPGQLLSGWTFETGQVCVVQHSIGPDDPRIAQQSEEHARSCIAVPTIVNGRNNGVIYVGTRLSPETDLNFRPYEISVLQLLGSIVGEFIERQIITHKTRQSGLRTITNRPIEKKMWHELSNHLLPSLHDIKYGIFAYDNMDNLHLMVVRVDNYREIQIYSDEIAGWVSDLIANTAAEFYRRYYEITPVLIKYSPSEFVLVVNHIRLNDILEQELRYKLNKHLSTLVLPFDHGVKSLEVKCLVWSLSFRYVTLSTKLKDRSEQSLARELEQETEDALANLPTIYQAHIKEAEGAYRLASDLFERALKRTPNSKYLMRHLGKIRTNLGDYPSAIGYWERVLIQEKHPRHYQHLAEVYALWRDHAAALECYQKAANLDPDDPRTYLGWGQVLFAAKNFSEALDKFTLARSLDPVNQVTYCLREAEAHMGMRNYRQALDACERVLIWEKDNQDAIKLLLQISRNSDRGF